MKWQFVTVIALMYFISNVNSTSTGRFVSSMFNRSTGHLYCTNITVHRVENSSAMHLNASSISNMTIVSTCYNFSTTYLTPSLLLNHSLAFVHMTSTSPSPPVMVAASTSERDGMPLPFTAHPTLSDDSTMVSTSSLMSATILTSTNNFDNPTFLDSTSTAPISSDASLMANTEVSVLENELDFQTTSTLDMSIPELDIMHTSSTPDSQTTSGEIYGEITSIYPTSSTIESSSSTADISSEIESSVEHAADDSTSESVGVLVSSTVIETSFIGGGEGTILQTNIVADASPPITSIGHTEALANSDMATSSFFTTLISSTIFLDATRTQITAPSQTPSGTFPVVHQNVTTSTTVVETSTVRSDGTTRTVSTRSATTSTPSLLVLPEMTSSSSSSSAINSTLTTSTGVTVTIDVSSTSRTPPTEVSIQIDDRLLLFRLSGKLPGETYTDALKDRGTEAFQDMEEKVKTKIDTALLPDFPYQVFQIAGFRNGSVVFDANLQYNYSLVNATGSKLIQALQDPTAGAELQDITINEACTTPSCNGKAGICSENQADVYCICNMGYRGHRCSETYPVNVRYGAWTDWSACSKSCNGTRMRTMSCDRPAPFDGGMLCSNDFFVVSGVPETEKEACNEDDCDDDYIAIGIMCGLLALAIIILLIIFCIKKRNDIVEQPASAHKNIKYVKHEIRTVSKASRRSKSRRPESSDTTAKSIPSSKEFVALDLMSKHPAAGVDNERFQVDDDEKPEIEDDETIYVRQLKNFLDRAHEMHGEGATMRTVYTPSVGTDDFDDISSSGSSNYTNRGYERDTGTKAKLYPNK